MSHLNKVFKVEQCCIHIAILFVRKCKSSARESYFFRGTQSFRKRLKMFCEKTFLGGEANVKKSECTFIEEQLFCERM